jgi:hypothetical protein
MRRYLLDSGIASDLINRRHGIPERCQLEVTRGNRIGLGMPVLAELVYGIEYGENRDRLPVLVRNAGPKRSSLWSGNASG